MRSLRSRLSYANVISTLCLFMLLGGGAYAAGGLSKGSVGTKQLKNGAVTGKKIKQGTIGASKLAPSAIASLQGSKGERGAAGPRGAEGPEGRQGPEGLTNAGAYATVVAEIPPVFLGSHPGFSAVERLPDGGDEARQGIYCLTPTPGTDVSHPLASLDGDNSAGAKFFIDPYAEAGVVDCEEGKLEVHTYKLGEKEGEESGTPFVPFPSNDASFTIFVPTGP
jgi:hypothetical protein